MYGVPYNLKSCCKNNKQPAVLQQAAYCFTTGNLLFLQQPFKLYGTP